MKKKLNYFVRVRDVITIPSGNDRPTDMTDFKVDFGMLAAMREDHDLLRVNIIIDDSLWKEIGYYEYRSLKNVLGYFFVTYIGVAAMCFDSWEDAIDSCLKLRCLELTKTDTWLVVGEGYENIDYVSKEDYLRKDDEVQD